METPPVQGTSATPPNALPPVRTLTLATAVGILGPALAVIWPILAFPAMAALLWGALTQERRARRWVLGVGIPVLLLASLRFVMEMAMPNVVSAGQHRAEEVAVSRLREVLWAEKKARDLKWRDADHNGVGEFVPLELLRTPPHGDPLLKPDMYPPTPQDPAGRSYHQTDMFLVAIYLPGPGQGWEPADSPAVAAVGAEQHFLAYAWPAYPGRFGSRVFVLDERDVICESANSAGYAALTKVPQAGAALGPSGTLGEACGPGGDGSVWKPWRNRKPKPPAEGGR